MPKLQDPRLEAVRAWLQQGKKLLASESIAAKEDTAIALLQDLCSALNGAFISTWQSTQAWQKELDAANEYLENHK